MAETAQGKAVSMVNFDKTPYRREVEFALQTVRIAGHLAKTVQQQMVTPALTKTDQSPVTVADYAVQALVGYRLAASFPHDPLVAEESSDHLTDPSASETVGRIADFVRMHEPVASAASVIEWVERGNGKPGRRFWTLDPIDGTKGFLRKGQYAVALALIEEGRVQVGAICCPELDLTSLKLPDSSVLQADNGQADGSVAIAVRGAGAWQSREAEAYLTRMAVSQRSAPADAVVVRSFESGHTNVEMTERLLSRLGASRSPLKVDSQVKGVLVAVGFADIMFRLIPPGSGTRKEKIWDQAAASLLIEEAGGRITDLDGKPLDFSAGTTLLHNRGILASNGHLHAAVLEGLRFLE